MKNIFRLAGTVRISLFPIMLFFSGVVYSQATPPSCLLALSKTGHTLAIVDPVSLNIIAKVPVGQDPHEVIASSDGKTAYVTIYGGGAFHEINVIDLVAQKALPTIDTRPLFGPHGIVFVNGKIWFSAEGSKAVGRYDVASGKLDWSMGTGQERTHMIYVTNDEKKVYTTNITSGTVSIITDTLIQPARNAPANARPRQDWSQTIIPTARGSEGFDITPDGNELWTASSENGTITIIDLNAKKESGKLDAKVFGANRLKFTNDGKLAFIASLQSGNLTVYDTKSRSLVKQIPIGKGAAGIQMDPDGSRVFVACSPDNYIAVIDLKTLAVTTKIDVGANPDGLAWATRK